MVCPRGSGGGLAEIVANNSHSTRIICCRDVVEARHGLVSRLCPCGGCTNFQTCSISSGAPSNAVVGGSSYFPTGSCSSGLFSYWTGSGACSVTTGGQVSFAAGTGTGSCTVWLNNDGDINWDPASSPGQTFTVSSGSQTVSFTSSPGCCPGFGQTYFVSASATSGLPVSITTATPGVCSLSGNTVSFIGVGTCVLNANQGGSVAFLPASNQQAFSVGGSAQSLSFTSAPSSGVFNGAPFLGLAAVSSAGLTPVVLSIDFSATAVCSLSGNTVSFIGAGTCTINANQAGNVNVQPAPQLQRSFSVSKASQTITLGAAPSGSVFGGSYVPVATASSGLDVFFSVTAPCTFSAGVVSFSGAGSCTTRASQPGNPNFAAAVDATHTFTVAAALQSLAFSTSPGGRSVGGPVYTVAASASSGLAVVFSSRTPGICTVTGSTVRFVGAGTCTIDANQGGSTNFQPVGPVPQSFAVAQGSQTITFSAAPASATVKGTYTFTASASSGLAVTVTSSTPAICTVAGNVATFVNSGTCTINGVQVGDANWLAVGPVGQSFGVGLAAQTITITSTAPPSAVYQTGSYTPSATASSGLPVTITTSGACTKTGSVVTFTATGTCSVLFDQAGSATFNAAIQLVQTIPVNKAPQTVSFTSSAPGSAVVGGPAYSPISAVASTAFAVTFASSTPGVCTISGVTVSFVSVGTCTLLASQAGDGNFLPGSTTQSFAVGQGSQTISFVSFAPSAATMGGAVYTVSATASSGLAVSFASATSAVCAVGGATVSFLSAGTCTVIASQSGSTSFTAAASTQQTFTVFRGPQTVSITSAPPARPAVGSSYQPTGSATSGLPVAFGVSTAAVCTLSFGNVNFISPGTCTVTAEQAGSNNFNAAAQVVQSFEVFKGTQDVFFTSSIPASAMVGGASYAPTAVSSRGVAVSVRVSSVASAICSIAAGVVTYQAPGTCVLAVDAAPSPLYDPPALVEQSFVVSKGSQSITFTTAAPSAAAVAGSFSPVAVLSSGLPVVVTVDTSSATVCSISSGVVSFIFLGTCTLNANQAGSAAFNPAPQVQLSFGVSLPPQTVTVTSLAPTNAVAFGPTYTPTGTATSNLPVIFTTPPSSVGVCTVVAGAVNFVGAGICMVDSVQNGNGAFNAAPVVQQVFSVGKGLQTVSFTSVAPVGAFVGGATYKVSAASNRPGLVVDISIDTSSFAICSLSEGIVSFQGAGSCVINAFQSGTLNVTQSTIVQQSILVAKGSHNLFFASVAPAGAQVGGGSYTATAVSTAGLSPVQLTVSPASAAFCSLSGNVVSFTAAGTCTLLAKHNGDLNYNAAPQAMQSFVIGKGSQTVSFTSAAPVGAVVGVGSYTPTVVASSGLPVSFFVDPSAALVCSAAGGVVMFSGAGACVLNANQGGNLNFNAALQQQSFFVGRTGHTLTITSPAPAATVLGADYAPIATSSAGLVPVTFTASGACSATGGIVSFFSVGQCIVTAFQGGNANVASAITTQSINVGQGAQTISFTSAAPSNPVIGGSYSVSAVANSGLPVTFSIDATSMFVCRISGSTVGFLSVGNCRVNANAAGDVDFSAAPQAQQLIGIGLTTQTITVTSTAPTGAVVSGTSYLPTATASSGLAVVFSVAASSSAVCRLQGASVVFIGAGTCIVSFDQPGSAAFNAAPQIQQAFAVSKGTPTVTFSSTVPVGAVAGGSYIAGATSNVPGLSVGLEIDPAASAVCVIDGSKVSFIGIGVCVVNGVTVANANFVSQILSQSFTVGKGSQTLQFTVVAPAGAQVQGTPFLASAIARSLLVVSFTSTTPGVCAATSGGVVSFVSAGSCTIQADQAGNANWNAAAPITMTFPVFSGLQIVSFTSTAPVGRAVGGPVYTVAAIAIPSGLPVTFSIDSASSTVCTIAGNGVSFTGAGNCVILGSQGGNAQFGAASSQQVVSVIPATQTVAFTSAAPVAPVVGGATYTALASASSGLPVSISVDTAASSICSIAAGVVSFLNAGSCVLNVNQIGNGNFRPAVQVQMTFTVGKGVQVISLLSKPPSAAFVNGSTFSFVASSSSGLPVTLAVDPAAAAICTLSGNTVSFIGSVSNCILNADQLGNANFLPATREVMSFAVGIAPAVLTFTPAQLFLCATTNECSTMTSSIFGQNLTIEARARSEVTATLQRYANCSASPRGDGSDWLSDCNVKLTVELFGLNGGRAVNLNSVLTKAVEFNASCTSQSCRDVMRFVIDAYTPVAIAAATSCATPECAQVASGASALSLRSVATGGPSAMQQEKERFDRSIAGEMLQALSVDTFGFAQCNDPGCASAQMSRTNVSFAIHGYINQAAAYGMAIANDTKRNELIKALDTNFTQCVTVVAKCSIPEVNSVFRQKRAILRYLTAWNNRLAEISAVCVAPACDISNERSATERQMQMMTDYLPFELVVPAWILYSLVFVAAAVIFALGVFWKAHRGKELFMLVLIGIALTCIDRLVFFSMGWIGVGTSSLVFVILDKTSSLLFALTILVFVYMWSKAIAVLTDARPIFVVILTVSAIAVAVAIAAVTIFYAVSISRTFVSAFYGVYVYDFAEIIVAAFTLVLVLLLFALILVVGMRLRQYVSGGGEGGKSEMQQSVDEKLRNLRIILMGVLAMVLFLAMRFTVVALRNFGQDQMLGYITFYDIATLIPEIVCCLIMLAIVLFTLYQSKPMRLSTMLSKSSKSSKSEAQRYAPSADSEEMMEHLLPSGSSLGAPVDDRYDV